tara:strand:+ start:1267 stop:2643 length:1377 start_codon:yes stop_codon:yes gene_type:complete
MSSNLKVNTILPSVGSNIGIGTNGGELNVDGGCKVQVGTALTLGHSIGLQYATQNLHSEGFEINQINASGIITASQFKGDGSQLTGISGVSVANQADNRLITATGTTDALNGEANLTFDGTNLDLGDDKKIRIGASQDLQIFHDAGAGSNIRCTGTKLEIRSDSLILQASNAEKYLVGTANGAVDLYFNNNKKVETTDTGAVVTGILTATSLIKSGGNVNIDGNFNCLSDNRGIYFGGSNQLRILGLDNGDSIIDAVSGSCKIQDNGSGCITFGGGSVQVYQKFNVDYAVSGSDYCAYIRNQNANSYGLNIQEPSSVNTGYPLLAVGNSSGGNHFRVDSGGLVYANSGAGTEKKAYFVRAWIAFKAAGNANITRGSGNATMTDHGTGDFSMNFTTAMPDSGYCAFGSAGYNSGVVMLGLTGSGTHSSPQTSGFRFCVRANYSNSTLMDEEYINICVVR